MSECKTDCECHHESLNKAIDDKSATKEQLQEALASLNRSNEVMSPDEAAQIEQLIYELSTQHAPDPCKKVLPTLRNDRGDKLGRNDPCPCNSGKKWKKCCKENF